MRPWTKTHDALVAAKHKEGKSIQQIAKELKQPQYKVFDAHGRLKLKPRFAEPKPKEGPLKGTPRMHNPGVRPSDIGPIEGANPVREAERILRGRLTLRRGIELLDGHPCTLDDKMREANRILHKGGFPQLGRKREWLW